MEYDYVGDECNLRIPLFNPTDGRRIENILNCDIFIDDCILIICVDMCTFKTRFQRPFGRVDLEIIEIHYDSVTHCFRFSLPCGEVSERNEQNSPIIHIEPPLDLWKLRRLTPSCRLKIDNNEELLKFEANFGYGFASKYTGKLKYCDDLETVLRVREPHLTSLIQRKIDREIDELKFFSRDQYKLNFIELQVPEGHDNPLQYKTNFNDISLSVDQQRLLHNITSKGKKTKYLPKDYNKAEIENGLISILCGICYDIRITSNEPTCQSAWTRSVVSGALFFFETYDTLKEVLISFMRRVLVYPLYRHLELASQCVNDVATALRFNPRWALKQLLITHNIFSTAYCSREIFNHYFIEDYILYLADLNFSLAQLNVLGHNVRNVLIDITRGMLGLNLNEIESELLRELITGSEVSQSGSSEGEEEEDFDDEEAEEEDSADFSNEPNGEDGVEYLAEECSSSSDTEENSVIEQSNSQTDGCVKKS